MNLLYLFLLLPLLLDLSCNNRVLQIHSSVSVLKKTIQLCLQFKAITIHP